MSLSEEANYSNIDIMSRLSHPGLSKRSPDDILLSEILSNSVEIATEQKIAFMYNLAEAVAFLHYAGATHRDLSPAVIAIRGNTAAIIDFSRATYRPSSSMPKEVTLYTPPDLYYTQQGDVWSLGMIFLGIILGTFPQRPRDVSLLTFLRSLLEDNPLRDGIDLLFRMLDSNSLYRISSRQITRCGLFVTRIDKERVPGRIKTLPLPAKDWNVEEIEKIYRNIVSRVPLSDRSFGNSLDMYRYLEPLLLKNSGGKIKLRLLATLLAISHQLFDSVTKSSLATLRKFTGLGKEECISLEKEVIILLEGVIVHDI